MKYKIIQFKNIWRWVPSSHNASIAAKLQYIKQLNEVTVYHNIARFVNSLLKYVYSICYFFVAGETQYCSDRETFFG